MMFADRARYPHPHQLVSPLHLSNAALDYHDGNPQSFQARAKEGQLLLNTNPQKMPQILPHYILPLQDTNSQMNHAMPKAVSQSHPVDRSEHMLRRKTPNGTLSAGYDGTPVDWVSRPHASKHLLVPDGNWSANGSLPSNRIYSDASTQLSGQQFAMTTQTGQQDLWPVQSPSFKQRINSTVMGDQGLGNGQWLPQDMRPPMIDSVLHQAPIGPQSYMSTGGYPQIPTNLQPMWPLAAAPTASNAQYSYGPYWPDGSFEPYRPFALRDQFNSQFANINLNSVPDFQAAPDRQQWSRRSAPVVQRIDFDSGIQNPIHIPSRMGVSRSYSDCFSARRSRTYQQSPQQTQFHDAAASATLAQNQALGRSNSNGNNGPWTAPCPTTSQLPRSPMVDVQASASPQQLKPRVLAWAHRVYVNLVYQSKKKALRHSTENGHVRASIYPKPPAAGSQSSAGTRESSQRPSAAATSDGDHQIDQISQRQDHTEPISHDTLQTHWPAPKSRSTFHERHDRGLRLTENLSSQMTSPVVNMQPSPGFIMNPSPFPIPFVVPQPYHNPALEAQTALEMLERMCQDSGWQWIDGILLGGCLAYGLEHFNVALHWYSRVLQCDRNNVEAISNTAATLLALKRRKEAEQHWYRAVWLRPRYFEAVEHLVGLLCSDSRGRDAINVIEHVEEVLRIPRHASPSKEQGQSNVDANLEGQEQSTGYDADQHLLGLSIAANRFGSSGYQIPSSDNGRLLALIHAKGNLLYATGDNAGAAKAFEDAVMIVSGRRSEGISGLIKHILGVFAEQLRRARSDPTAPIAPCETTLLHPGAALKTAECVFPPDGQLPGLRDVVDGQPKKAAVAVASNSLLSLAKIYQDGMSSSGGSSQAAKNSPGVQDILALYYLSLSLSPSPSTANNIGILLASVQHAIPPDQISTLHRPEPSQVIPGVRPGSGIALALSYYNYGLNLDTRHAHLYTNLGSLLKDIGQLNAAIKMYEQAVACDGYFDIALANLANAVKDQGRIKDAIGYYRRAVASNGEFAEAVCGLANALNSVCCWKGRGGIVFADNKYDRWHVDEEGMLQDGNVNGKRTAGWIGRVVSIVKKQLRDGQSWGRGILRSKEVEKLLTQQNLLQYVGCDQATQAAILKAVKAWAGQEWEGAKLLRLFERATKRLGWLAYQEKYVTKTATTTSYVRPRLPNSLPIPSAPTVLPFHTFTCPLTASQVRKISQRNGLRISCSTLKAPWLPSTIFVPPPPPSPQLRVGYVSSDFNNHPLAHLMQSVFGFHDQSRVKAYCYATTASDGSSHRDQIQREAPAFHDAASWPTDKLVRQIVADGIHILVNLNGYTRGARNEVFAARPAPVQMSFMGFAGTLGAEWCDYLLADQIAVPPGMLRPYRQNVSLLDQTRDDNFGASDEDPDADWVYGENVIFARDTFFCCDHRQSAPDSGEAQLSWPDEQERRKKMRKELFPGLAEDVVIMGNFNQLYKIEPTTFRTWLRILQAVPQAVLWLLRFPDLGETNLRETAAAWASPGVASRLVFTDVAPKHQHIARARVCDLFLDTPECNAHTTAADVLWSGTPLLTLPRYPYKMCSRMAASILRGALPQGAVGDAASRELVALGEEDYERRAAELGRGLARVLRGEADGCRLLELRRILYEGRWTSALFDTRRWVRDLEDAYEEAWRRWVADEGGDIWL